jgi:hypothetical protein
MTSFFISQMLKNCFSSLLLSFPCKRESSFLNRLLDTRFRGYDNLFGKNRLFQQSIRLLISLFIFLNASALHAETVMERFMKASKGGSYEEPAAKELEKAEELFGYLFKGILTDNVQQLSDKINFKVVRMKEGEEEFILLVEKEAYKRGRGFYLFRQSNYKKLAIQSPHSVSDLYTGEITLELALEGRIVSAAWNTVPRSFIHDEKSESTDLAHLKDNYFAAYARAFARAYPSGNLIQLHGFTKEKRKSKTGSEPDIIVSSGSKAPGRRAEQIDRCLQKSISGTVSLYPVEIDELGGSTNTTGIALRNMGYYSFIHIELSKPMRLLLKNDKKVRTSFRGCIEGAAEDE